MEPNRISGGQALSSLDAATPEDVATRFAELRARFDVDAMAARDENAWKLLRDAWLGRKSGVITHVTDTWLKPARPELKRAIGQALNELKAHVEAALESRRLEIEAAADQTALTREREDLSLPGVTRPLGSRHPLRQTFEEIERIFLSLGFSVVAGPEMETPYYNF
ncbi:MAG: phenylalanyl-tRNA synthetase, alpha subunit, partial [Candidatus Acidoferrum typicum]|nr:phenylalanyl-tRNA synthetase, alpha subunit [Candidatus Acidoferrum typicum]